MSPDNNTDAYLQARLRSRLRHQQRKEKAQLKAKATRSRRKHKQRIRWHSLQYRDTMVVKGYTLKQVELLAHQVNHAYRKKGALRRFRVEEAVDGVRIICERKGLSTL